MRKQYRFCTNDPDGKIAKENAERKAKENREKESK